MNFQESVDYLLSLGNEVSAMKLGLENMRKLLAALGDPQKNYLKIQVAGTNGKGSVCAFLNTICSTTGIETGMYTSPHLVSITERIQFGRAKISESEFPRFAREVRKVSEDLVDRGELDAVPTFFEQVTAIALLAFAAARVDLAILETGLGGRLDATTAAEAEIAVITRIDYDHQNYLGETIEEIAAEKAAIIRSEKQVVVVGAQRPEALQVILDRCREVGAVVADDLHGRWTVRSTGADSVQVCLDTSTRIPDITLGLNGRHQIENAETALNVVQTLRYQGYGIRDQDILTGLMEARHPGRLEWLECNGVPVLLDGAHNRGGAEALLDYLKSEAPRRRTVLVYGSMNDKDYEGILTTLSPVVTDLIVTEPENQRAVPAATLAEGARPIFGSDNVFVVPEVEQALDSAVQLASGYQNSLVLVTGSLYLVGEVRNLLKSQI